jgi:hypothetical protein
MEGLLGKDAEINLPRPDSRISYELKNVSPELAAAIRTAYLQQLEGAHLMVPISNIVTSRLAEGSRIRDKPSEGMVDSKNRDQYFIPEYFQLRLQHICIPHDIDQDMIFSIGVKNEGKTPKVIYSGDLEAKGGQRLPFEEGIRLAMLSPGCELKVTGISVRRGYGYNHSSFFTSGNYKFAQLDYRPIDFINAKGRITGGWVHRTVIDPKGKYTPEELMACRPLFRIKDAVVKDRIDNRKDQRVVSAIPQLYSSTQVRSSHYYLSIRLVDCHEPVQTTIRVMKCMLGRLEVLGDKLTEYISSWDTEAGVGGIIMTIKDETISMGSMLRERIYSTDTNTFVTTVMDPHVLRTLIIRVAHPEAEQVVRKAIGSLKKDFENMLAEVLRFEKEYKASKKADKKADREMDEEVKETKEPKETKETKETKKPKADKEVDKEPKETKKPKADKEVDKEPKETKKPKKAEASTKKVTKK